MKSFIFSTSFIVVVLFSFVSPADPQTQSSAGSTDQQDVKTDPSPTPTPRSSSLERHFIQDVIRDQGVIWTAPFKFRNYDSKWAPSIGIAMAGLIATDRYTTGWVDHGGGLPLISRDVSWFGKTYVPGGVAAGFYLAGRFTHNARERETGVLAAQALIDTGIVTRVLKVATQRPRPNSDNGSAEFWDHGSSFPSGHASTVWSVATVIAYEYKDHPWIRYGAFAAATAVSMSRYSGRNHFLSDIVGGSALGFLVGRYVEHRYHDSNIDISASKKTTWLRPEFAPYFNSRTHTYGGALVWRL